MPKKYKYKRPRLASRMSTLPAIFPDRSAIEAFRQVIQNMPGRVQRGRELFLLEVGRILIGELQKNGPTVRIGGQEIDYTKQLVVDVVEGVRDAECVAVYFKECKAKITKKALDNTVVFFSSLPNSPGWVGTMSRFGPWPASMIPMKVGAKDARLVSRNARPDEVDALAKRIYARRGEIEGNLQREGAPQFNISKGTNAVGSVVHEDVGYNVLRREFGWDGDQQEPHWRPAFRVLRDEVPLVMEKFIRYLETGQENVFEMPNKFGEISGAMLKGGEEFQQRLAPFVTN